MANDTWVIDSDEVNKLVEWSKQLEVALSSINSDKLVEEVEIDKTPTTKELDDTIKTLLDFWYEQNSDNSGKTPPSNLYTNLNELWFLVKLFNSAKAGMATREELLP